jgi:hypothetical protein
MHSVFPASTSFVACYITQVLSPEFPRIKTSDRTPTISLVSSYFSPTSLWSKIIFNMEKKIDLEPVALHAEQTRESTVMESEKAGIVRDYSGAIVVLNPIEQALVRKLDYRIMVCLLFP